MDLTTAERWDPAAQVRALVRTYCDEVIRPLRPHVREWVSPAQARIPWEALEEGSRRGLRTLGVPVARGGGGADVATLCVAAEELARADMGIAVAFDQTWKCAATIESLGTEDQKDWFYERFLDDHRFLLAIAMTEPANGSDKYIYPDGAFDTRARRVDGGWVLNGHKRYISNASEAKLVLLYARTDEAAPLDRGVSCFLVPHDADGFAVGQIHEKISQRLVNNAELIVTDLFVREDRVLGPLHRALARSGDPSQIQYARGGNAEAAATTLGTAWAAYDAALAWAEDREQGGRRIIEHQAIGFLLADMATRLEAARSLVWRAARAVDSGADDAAKLISMAKVYAADTAVAVCLKAMEVLGGASIMLEHPVQKYLRDCLSFLHSDGTQQVHAHRVLTQLRREVRR